jgi:hypothetical protein
MDNFAIAMNKGLLRTVYRRIEAEQQTVETQILCWPTGLVRDKLCDMNIHLMATLELLRQVVLD